MSKADGRPARPGEVPAFGSVWVWEDATIHYVALGAMPRNSIGWRSFAALVAETGNPAGEHLIWGTDDKPLAGWRCVDEGPK